MPRPMPTMRATVTVPLAMPKADRPAASTAAVVRGVTVRPKPRPKSDTAAIGTRRSVSRRTVESRSRPRMLVPRPMMVTTMPSTRRTAKPETKAPSAMARASGPSRRPCSSGPAKRTRSTKVATPMMAVASA